MADWIACAIKDFVDIYAKKICILHKQMIFSRVIVPMQFIHDFQEGIREQLMLPTADTELLPGVRWGLAQAVFTPAFWAVQAWLDRGNNAAQPAVQWSKNLSEEVVGCLLGGFGISYELNLAAFERLRDENLLIEPHATEDRIRDALLQPLDLNGRKVKYRFPVQKSRFVFAAIQKLSNEGPPGPTSLQLRDWLMTFPGIGPKTASWITRNHMQADEVAILDIHVLRAGVIMGLFASDYNVGKDYMSLEERFLIFAKKISVRASILDLLIWKNMRDSGALGIAAFRAAA